MGMTIDNHIEVLKSYHNGFTGQVGNLQESIDVAIDTMRKYQKIEGLVEYHMLRFLSKERMHGFQKDVLEVIDNGNDD